MRPCTFILLLASSSLSFFCGAQAKLADRSRVVKNRGGSGRFLDNGRPLEGPNYRANIADAEASVAKRLMASASSSTMKKSSSAAPWKLQSNDVVTTSPFDDTTASETSESDHRHLSSQLSGCCYTYNGYKASNMCYLYGNDCESGETPSHDSGDDDCSQEGLSFIGISFSVNTASGNPYSYQLCDQFPMENIIDRDYEYVMSMDEDGWLVGGGYKTFDYSGKMP